MPEIVQAVEYVPISKVFVEGERRDVDEDRVQELAKSFKRLGQLSPILVTKRGDEGYRLLAGMHRISAAMELRWESVKATIYDVDDVEAELIEISENIHRADLTEEDRSKLVNRWVELTEQKRQEEGGRGRPGGVAGAARELNMSEAEVRRRKQIAEGVTDEAWKRLHDFPEYKLWDNVSFLNGKLANVKKKINFPCPEDMDPDGDEYHRLFNEKVVEAQLQVIDDEVDKREQRKAERQMEKANAEQAKKEAAEAAKAAGEETPAPEPKLKTEETEEYKRGASLLEGLKTYLANMEDFSKRRKVANALARYVKALGSPEE